MNSKTASIELLIKRPRVFAMSSCRHSIGSGFRTLLLLTALGFVGCSDSEPQVVVAPASETPQPLDVVFVNMPDVSNEISRQWSARRNGIVNAINISAEELFANEYSAIQGQDVIVYAGFLTGHLVADDKILEVPDEVWNSTDLENRGLLRDSRTLLIRFGGKRWATPLGSPNLFLFVRRDVLKHLKMSMPTSWAELIAVANRLSQADNLVGTDGHQLPTRVQFPLAGHYAADSLLAIAASTVRHRGKLNSVFDRDSMKPLIDSEPYIEALQSLKKIVSADQVGLPSEIIHAYVNGKSAIAVGWPSKAFVRDLAGSDIQSVYETTNLIRMPGSERWFDFSDSVWKPHDSGVERVELLGFSGYQASILKTAAYPTSAYEFLAWLSSKEISTSVFANSKFGGPTRLSHAGNPEAWIGDSVDVENSDEYSALLLEINEESIYLLFPRIRGTHEYLSTLADAVRNYLSHDLNAATVLKDVASQWEEITERYDRKQQKELLRKDFAL